MSDRLGHVTQSILDAIDCRRRAEWAASRSLGRAEELCEVEADRLLEKAWDAVRLVDGADSYALRLVIEELRGSK